MLAENGFPPEILTIESSSLTPYPSHRKGHNSPFHFSLPYPMLKRPRNPFSNMRSLAAALILGLANAGAVPVISEIMFHPAHPNGGENPQEEWIEIYNPDFSNFNLAGWTLDGVDFTFPNITMGSREYLVIAAHQPTFRALHPEVTNVVGGWVGRLSNRGETIRLRDHTGREIDHVPYADGGDWAVRRPGPPDQGHSGWIWSNPADGGGKSYELRNLLFRNDTGQSWLPSVPDGGTPGADNSVLAVNTPPLIEEVSHHPAVPAPNNLVLIRAKLTDDLSGAHGVVHHRVSTLTPRSFTTTPLRDDGLYGDEKARDDIHSAVLPAQPEDTVVEFYIEASDRIQSRTWPGPTSEGGTQGANLLYQVDSEPHNARTPFYRLILSAPEDDEFQNISLNSTERNTDAHFNASFIAQLDDEFSTYYQCGMRLRGSGTRSRYPRNLRLELPTTESWQGSSELNLNTQFTYNQLLGSLFYREAGLPVYESKAVQVRLNGVNHTAPENSTVARPFHHHFGMYVHNEPVNSRYVKVHYPQDAEGNLYRMAGSGTSWDYFPGSQNLGADYSSVGWDKENNAAIDDWTDLHHFIGVMSTASGPDYLEQVEAVMDLESWLRNLAVSTILTNAENSLFTGRDDDYGLYRGSDGRFKLVPHDLDTILGEGDTSRIGIEDLPHTILDFVDRGESFSQLQPLFENPAVQRRYYRILRELLEGPFEESRANRLIDNALTWTPPITAANAKAFLAARRANILNLIERPLSATTSLPNTGGLPGTLVPDLELEGTYNATDAAAVFVNGAPAQIDLNSATWSINATGLKPGINRLVLEERAADDRVIGTSYLDVYYDDGNASEVGGDLQTNTVLDAGSGPWIVSSSLNVLPGVTLTIEPGTSVFFNPGAGLNVQSGGTLHCAGTPYARIRFSRPPETQGRWEGLTFNSPSGQESTTENVISYTDFEFGDERGQALQLRRSRLLLDHVSWNHSRDTVLELYSPQLKLNDCVFPSISNSEVIHGTTLLGDDYFILRRNLFASSSGYQDIIDFTGGRRPGPIFTAYDNVFTGATDDCFDLDNCDAHLEGNIFMHVHLDGPRDSTSNAIATDDNSHLTVVRNLFYDVDHALLLKNEADCIFENNTVVQATIAAINFDEPLREGFVPGERINLDSNIFLQCNAMFAHAASVPPEPNPIITGNFNILPALHHAIGQGNLDLDPFLKNLEAGPLPKTNWSLLPGSPARQSGQNGMDRGALVAQGAHVFGLPPAITRLTSALLRVDGPGVTQYRWRLVTNEVAGAWSNDFNLGSTISLSNLPAGRHHLDLLSRDSAGYWQDATDFTSTPSWEVDPLAPGTLILSEVHARSKPDVDTVEIHNPTSQAVPLGGWFLTDDPDKPQKAPLSGTLPAGGFLTLSDDEVPGLSQTNEQVMLLQGNTLIDSVSWGSQLGAYTIGRTTQSQEWTLTIPTPNAPNQAAGLTPARHLRINEWLADSKVRYLGEFVEIHNPGDSPAQLGGLSISDTPDQPHKYQLPPHTFIPAHGYMVFYATGNPAPTAHELPFHLDGYLEWLVLTDPDGITIDQVPITCQQPDVVEGRNPDGSANVEEFPYGTPGRSNNRAMRVKEVSTLLPFHAEDWTFLDNADPDLSWKTFTFDDTSWETGPAPLGRETSILPFPLASHSGSNPAFNYRRSRKNYYFRRTFEFDGNPSQTTLSLATYLDDGAVFYLNGRELYRHNVPAGRLTENTWSERTISNAVFEGPFPVPSDNLVNGTNILAVVTYQAAANSSDIVFDCELTASESIAAPPEPAELALQILLDNLRITELMYNPPGGDEGEYIELQNISGTITLDLTGVRFTEGVEFVFPALSLAPGELIVVVKDQVFFEDIHGAGINIAGTFESKFSNDGESVALTLPEPWDVHIQKFTYTNRMQPQTDATGRSLELRDAYRPLATWNEATAWMPSFAPDGTPGSPNGASSFASWAASLQVGEGDTDGDTLSDPFEYAYGLDPHKPNFVPILLNQTIHPTDGSVSTFHIPAVVPEDVIFHIQSSPDLRTWTTQAIRISNGPWIGPSEVESVQSSGGLGIVRVHLPSAPQLFTRVLVEFFRSE